MEWILPLAAVLIAGKLGAEAFARLRQSTVVGEIVAGVVLANIAVVAAILHPAENEMKMLAGIGVIFMMLMVGLETRLRQILAVGKAAFAVALAGVAIPFAFGYLLTLVWGGDLFNEGGMPARLFLSTVLVATSIAVTARVFIDMGTARGRTARTILAAAILDDILGLLILTGILAIVGSSDKGGGRRALEAGLFLLVFMPLLWFLVPRLLRWLRRLEGEGSMFIMVLGLTFGVAYVAEHAGLASIVGVFLLGMILAEGRERDTVLKDLKPLYWFLGPIFFVHAGMQVQLAELGSVLLFGGTLCVVAVVSKVLGGVVGSVATGGGWRSGVVVGVGMAPRGEVGLIIATIGHEAKILNDELFAAIALMSLVTIVVVPPMLKGLAKKWPDQFVNEEEESR